MSRAAASARPSAAQRIQLLSGTVWALKEATTLAIVQGADVASALAVPGVAGYSVRIPWSSLWQNGAPADPLGLIAGAAAMLNTGQKLMIRFIAGTRTPADVIAAVDHHEPASPCGDGVSSAPTPFHGGSGGDNVSGKADGSPNTEFEAIYTNQLNFVIQQGRNLGSGVMAMVRAPWYGDQYAELNHGLTVRGLTGYTYQNWLTGHKRLFDIARLAAIPYGLPYEHPLTGCGPIQGGGTPASQDLATYMAAQDAGRGLAVAQGNGAGLQNYASQPGNADPSASNQGFGMAGNTTLNGEAAFKAALLTPGLVRAAQMIQPGDYTSWRQIFNGVISYGARIFEIYAGLSFTGAHAADLATEILRFNAAFGLRTTAGTRLAAS